MRSIRDIIVRRRPVPEVMPEPHMMDSARAPAPAETPEDVINGKTMIDTDLQCARDAVNFVPKPEKRVCRDQPDWSLSADELEFTPKAAKSSAAAHVATQQEPSEDSINEAPEPEVADMPVPTPISTSHAPEPTPVSAEPQSEGPETPVVAPKIWNTDVASASIIPQERPQSRPIEPAPQVAASRPERAPIPTPDSMPDARPVRRVGSERVKTRLLGFHSDSGEGDVFAGAPEEASSAIPMFPIGWLVVVDGPGRGASYTLTGGLSTIGRDANQTVALDFGDTSISRERHASVAYDEEDKCVYVGHGGKSNIVRHNGKPLLTTEQLDHGDTLKIGKTSLRYIAFCNPEFAWDPETDLEGPHD